MRNTGLDEAQAGIKIAGRNISNFRYADDTTLMAESEEGLKSLLMKVKEERGKIGLKLNIQKTRLWHLVPSWEIDGEAVETVTDFIFGGSKITADGDCSHEIKRRLLLGRKVMTNLDSILKSTKEMMLLNYGVGGDSWDIVLDFKEIQSVYPKGNQSWIFIARIDVGAETRILWPPDAKNWVIGKDHDAGKDWRQQEKGTTENVMVGRYHQLNGHEFEWTLGFGDGQGGLACCSWWSHKEWTRLSHWTELNGQ